MSYACCFFDLDGTLTDPERGIVNSLRHMETRLGLEPLPAATLRLFIGPPLHESLIAHYGIAEADIAGAMAAYREHFAELGLFENDPIPGVVDMLRAVRASGARIALATSKPEVFALRILERYGLLPFFDAVQGSPLAAKVHSKDQILALAMEKAGFAAGKARGALRGAMVGDRDVDILAARKYGLDGIAVAWGFAAAGELEAAGPVAAARDMAELARLLTT